jgi:hypothetical protein
MERTCNVTEWLANNRTARPVVHGVEKSGTVSHSHSSCLGTDKEEHFGS